MKHAAFGEEERLGVHQPGEGRMRGTGSVKKIFLIQSSY